MAKLADVYEQLDRGGATSNSHVGLPAPARQWLQQWATRSSRRHHGSSDCKRIQTSLSISSHTAYKWEVNWEQRNQVVPNHELNVENKPICNYQLNMGIFTQTRSMHQWWFIHQKHTYTACKKSRSPTVSTQTCMPCSLGYNIHSRRSSPSPWCQCASTPWIHPCSF